MTATNERDPELSDVLDEVARQLDAIASITGQARDDALARLEAYAGPYALAFVHEIRRLDALLTTDDASSVGIHKICR
jgi:predicted ATPase